MVYGAHGMFHSVNGIRCTWYILQSKYCIYIHGIFYGVNGISMMYMVYFTV